MRVLCVGSGFSAASGGGHTRYALDLLAAQAAAGHEVSYLCAGRCDLTFTTRVRRGRLGAIRLLEVRNPRPGGQHLGRQDRPEREVADAATERLVRRVVDEVRPAVVHVQALQGWPASLLAVLADSGTPTIMSVGNFHPLCPTTRLYDEADDEVCTDFRDGRRCCRCMAARAPETRTRTAERLRLEALAGHAPRLVAAARRGVRALRAVLGGESKPTGTSAGLPGESAASRAFRARRAAYVVGLNRLDVVAGVSRRVCELLTAHGVEPSRVRVLSPVAGGIEAIGRRAPAVPSLPLRFGVLNKLTHLKGAGTLREAFLGLDPERVRLVVHGTQSREVLEAIAPLVEAGVAELSGPYERAQLDAILDGIDVGLMPSLLEETYGLVGQEFFAKGIPVLASRIGGMPDYVEDDVNGLLLPPRDAAAWRAAITYLANRPGEVARLSAGIGPVRTMAAHLREVDGVYLEAAARKSGHG